MSSQEGDRASANISVQEVTQVQEVPRSSGTMEVYGQASRPVNKHRSAVGGQQGMQASHKAYPTVSDDDVQYSQCSILVPVFVQGRAGSVAGRGLGRREGAAEMYHFKHNSC